MRDAHDDTPKADIRDKQRHSHAPKRSPPLGFKPPGTNRPISEKNGRPTFPATTASGLRVPQVAAKEEGSVLYVRDRRLRGKMGCPGLAQRQQKRGSLEPRKIVGADNGASAYPLRGSAPASAACRRPRQLATNAPRLLNARSLSGSSPGDGYKKARLPW